jgi:hypothetical protein
MLPTSELPWFRVSRKQGERTRRILEEHGEVAERVLERIRAEGALSSLDFERAGDPLGRAVGRGVGPPFDPLVWDLTRV